MQPGQNVDEDSVLPILESAEALGLHRRSRTAAQLRSRVLRFLCERFEDTVASDSLLEMELSAWGRD